MRRTALFLCAVLAFAAGVLACRLIPRQDCCVDLGLTQNLLIDLLYDVQPEQREQRIVEALDQTGVHCLMRGTGEWSCPQR